MKARTATSLVLTMRQLTRAGVAAEFRNMDSSDIVYARNFYANEVLKSDALDGLLFVDSDMEFRPALVLKMLRLGVDIAAAAYPRRALDLGRFARGVATPDGPGPQVIARALAASHQYTVILSWTNPKAEKLSIRNGFVRMAGAGMGCTLISRTALQAMVDGGAVEQRTDIMAGVKEVGWGFFDPLKADGVTLSEDYSFCYRWTRRLGRELWVNVDETVGHIGEFSYRARYLDQLTVTKGAPAPAADAAQAGGIDIDADAIVEAGT